MASACTPLIGASVSGPATGVVASRKAAAARAKQVPGARSEIPQQRRPRRGAVRAAPRRRASRPRTTTGAPGATAAPAPRRRPPTCPTWRPPRPPQRRPSRPARRPVDAARPSCDGQQRQDGVEAHLGGEAPGLGVRRHQRVRQVDLQQQDVGQRRPAVGPDGDDDDAAAPASTEAGPWQPDVRGSGASRRRGAGLARARTKARAAGSPTARRTPRHRGRTDPSTAPSRPCPTVPVWNPTWVSRTARAATPRSPSRASSRCADTRGTFIDDVAPRSVTCW